VLPPLGVVVGRFAPGSTAASPQIDFDANAGASLPARSIVALDDAVIERAIATRRGVVLQFEDGKAERPIIVGLIQEESSLLSNLLSGAARTETPSAPSAAAKASAPAMAARTRARSEARLDGKRVVLEAEHEIELRCGDASITLTRDGKIIVKGAYVETHSRGVNRIKGGAVKIN
jgi:uncharacterized protein YlzI (FlbEa/FlbD family)